METHFTGIDWIVLVVYFAATMGIGFYFYRRSRSTDGFTAGGRALPGWACGLSILATYLSSISFLALPSKAYSSDWNPFVFSLSLPIATWAAVRYFLPYYRRTAEVSAYAHLEHRFGPWARIYASVFYLLTQLARMGAVMYLMALPISVLLGWDIRVIILITGIPVTVYAFVGGIVAVIWADAMQSIVLMTGAGVCAVVMLLGMPQGAVAVQDLQSQGLDPSDPVNQAKLAAERDKLTDAEIGDKVFPHFIGAKLPVGVTGLLIAAVFAAAMSTVSTSLNSSATLIMRDYYQRYVNRLGSERQSMAVLYGATVVWGMLGTGVALLLVQVISALHAWWTLSGVFGGGMLGLFLLGMISRRARNPAAVTGVCLGILVIGWMTLSKYLPDRWTALRSPFHAFMIPVLGTLTILLSGLLVSRFTTSPTSIVCASEDNENSIERRTS